MNAYNDDDDSRELRNRALASYVKIIGIIVAASVAISVIAGLMI